MLLKMTYYVDVFAFGILCSVTPELLQIVLLTYKFYSFVSVVRLAGGLEMIAVPDADASLAPPDAKPLLCLQLSKFSLGLITIFERTKGGVGR